jgi:hypothetical protein
VVTISAAGLPSGVASFSVSTAAVKGKTPVGRVMACWVVRSAAYAVVASRRVSSGAKQRIMVLVSVRPE